MMGLLLVCPLLPEECNQQYLSVIKDQARQCVEYWHGAVSDSRRRCVYGWMVLTVLLICRHRAKATASSGFPKVSTTACPSKIGQDDESYSSIASG